MSDAEQEGITLGIEAKYGGCYAWRELSDNIPFHLNSIYSCLLQELMMFKLSS